MQPSIAANTHLHQPAPPCTGCGTAWYTCFLPPVKPFPQDKHLHCCSPLSTPHPCLIKTPLFLGLNNLPQSSRPNRGAAGWLGGLSLQQAKQVGKGAPRSPKHMGRGLPCHQHEPQQQQHCSHGDRKERTRLDQSRLEQTPPTITIIHNPHLPPSTAASRIYLRKNSRQVQYPPNQKSSSQGRGNGAALPSPPITQETQPRIRLGGQAGLTRFIGHHTVFSFKTATFEWDYTIKSCLVTRDCCRGLKRSASPAYWHMSAVQDFGLQETHFRKALKKI